jgi:hypothetical protein
MKVISIESVNNSQIKINSHGLKKGYYISSESIYIYFFNGVKNWVVQYMDEHTQQVRRTGPDGDFNGKIASKKLLKDSLFVCGESVEDFERTDWDLPEVPIWVTDPQVTMKKWLKENE